MEDKKRKKDDKRKREASQKVAEQKNKVPDSTKPATAQSPASQSSSASPSPGRHSSASPSPAAPGPGSAAPQAQGGNNAKRLAVANGQPSSTSSSSSSTAGGVGPAGGSGGGGAQASQQPQRYMPREVPPRFRCQQDHKVLLKRGQPPLSSMLLGGGGAGAGDNSNANMAAASESGASASLTSSSVAASTSSSNYANSTWGASSGSQASSAQGKEKVIVDGNDEEEWPSIGGSGGGGSGAGGGRGSDGGVSLMPANSTSASGNQPPPTSSFSSPDECMHSSNSVAWGTTACQAYSQGHPAGASAAAAPPPPQPSSLSKAAPAALGSHDASGAIDGNGGIPGANFSPNANPSAWPALVQQDGPAAAVEGGPSASFHHHGPGGPASSSSASSLGLGGGAAGAPEPHPSLSVNQPSAHQPQLHQMQSRESRGTKRDIESAGPKSGAGAAHGGVAGGKSTGENTLASSWRSQPSCPTASTEGWEGGRPSEGGNGTSGWGYPSSKGGGAWGSSGNGGQPSGVPQGGWGSSEADGEKRASGGEWGGDRASADVGNCSSSSGGSTLGNPPPVSSASTETAAAWDNQKGGEGETGEWGEDGGVGGQRARGGSSSSGGNSRSGNAPGGGNRPRRQTLNAEAALQNLLSRSDLDPRVLSNSGWGQTQIRQNTAWDLDDFAGPNRVGTLTLLKHPSGSSSSSSSSHGGAAHFAGGPRSLGTDTTGPGGGTPAAPSAGSSGGGWESSSSSSSGASLSGRAQLPTNSNMRSLGVAQSGPVAHGAVKPGGWGAGGRGNGDEGKDWGDGEWRGNREREKGGGWGDWGQERGGWKDVMENGERGRWGAEAKGRSGKDWGEQESKSSRDGGGGWGEERRSDEHSGGDTGWGDAGGGWYEGAPRRNWGAGSTVGGDVAEKAPMGLSGANKVHQMPNSQPAPGLQAQLQQQQQQSQPRGQQAALDQAGGGPRKPFSQVPTHNQSAGWSSDGTAGAGGTEPSGWEEPSPQSVSRKSEIDDGTSAWGDPTHYNYKPVNLWDKNSGPAAQQAHTPTQQLQQRPPLQPPLQQQHLSKQSAAIGDASGWGPSPASPNVDNGTAAWGKPSDAPSGWGDPDDAAAKSACWGNPAANPVRPGTKTMQDGWGEKESSVAASRHSSWEDEEDGGGMWNSAGSQGSGSSWGQGSNGGWAPSQHGRKPGNKGPVKAGGGDSWMSHMNRQFSNMGLLNDDPNSPGMDLPPGSLQEKKMEMEKRGGMGDYNGDLRKGGRGAGGGMMYRPPGSKEASPGDAGPYFDKTLHLVNLDGVPGEEGPCSLFSPPSVFKPHTLFNLSVPFRQGAPGIFGSAGGMSQSRHQQSIPTMNHSPGMRAQVPHQFLSPQVPGSVLKQMPPPSGGVGGVAGMAGVGGGVFPPQLSPQHLAMLSSIYPQHIQLQLLLLQQQQQQQQPQQQQLLQNQRKFTPNVRQQTDPQLARIMAVLRQQQQQQQVGVLGGSSKLSPSHHPAVGPKLPGLEPSPHPGLAASVPDMHQKNLGPYSGFGPAVNLPGLDLGSPMGSQQSRFKWMMEGNCSPDPSSPENAFNKMGPVTPVKMGSPYSQYDMMVGDGLGDGWHRTPGNKMSSKPSSTPSWPPEFQPGVPWKGIDRVDPESDPYMTPGSMMGNASSPGLNDSEHQLLENSDSTPPLNTLLPSPGAWPYSASDSPLNSAHNSAKYTEFKTSWPPEPIGHKSWKAGRGGVSSGGGGGGGGAGGGGQSPLSRPPPGLAAQKQQSPSPWSGGGPRLAGGRSWGSGAASSGSAWSDGSGARESCWLVLSNLTPQIDGSTLRTICMQHGPLLTFHLGLTQGSALIRYSSKQEASKAKSALHMCVLGNTTILAEFVSDDDVARFIAHSQPGGSGSGGAAVGAGAVAAAAAVAAAGTNGGGGGAEVTSASAGGGGPSTPGGWQSLDGSGSSLDPAGGQVGAGPGLGVFTQWSSNGGGGVGVEPGRQGLWGGGMSLWASPALEDRHQMGSPAALLPGDLLGGGADSI